MNATMNATANGYWSRAAGLRVAVVKETGSCGRYSVTVRLLEPYREYREGEVVDVPRRWVTVEGDYA